MRDQSDSPFSAILSRLCEDSGALAAALVDGEGETVDYAGLLSPYEIKVAAAEWRIVLAVARESRLPGISSATGMTIRALRRTFLIESMPDGYAIVLCLPRHSFSVSRARAGPSRAGVGAGGGPGGPRGARAGQLGAR